MVLPVQKASRALRELGLLVYFNGQLSCEAYFRRMRDRRSLLAPTLRTPPRALRRAALEGRALPTARFVRPTRFADSHAPEIVALADEIRSQTGSDWEYAAAIFEFVCNQIEMSFDLPSRRGVVGTLERGFGTCAEKLNVLVALARAGGIPARYCTIGIDTNRPGVLSLLGHEGGIFAALNESSKRFVAENNDPRAKRIAAFNLRCSAWFQRSLTRRILAGTLISPRNQWTHFVAELCVGTNWIAVDPTLSDEDCSAYNRPLQRFGYEPLVLTRFMGMAIKDRSEAIPFRWARYIFWLAQVLVMRGFFDDMNRFGERERLRGRSILSEIGAEAMMLKREHMSRRISATADGPG